MEFSKGTGDQAIVINNYGSIDGGINIHKPEPERITIGSVLRGCIKVLAMLRPPA